MNKNTNTQSKSPKVTKDSLLSENGKLMGTIEFERSEDRRMREIFSELLGSYETTQSDYSNRQERKLKLLSWLGIAFMIGELKSDADYSLLLSSREDFRNKFFNADSENQFLKKELEVMKMKYEKNSA